MLITVCLSYLENHGQNLIEFFTKENLLVRGILTMFWYRHMHYSGTSSSAASHVDIWDHKPAKRIMIKKITQLTETYYEKVPSAISYHSSVSTRIGNCCHIIIFLLCLPPWGSWVRPRVHYWWPPAPTKQHSQYKKKKEIKMGINLSPISNGWVLDTRINTYLCLHFRLLVYRW